MNTKKTSTLLKWFMGLSFVAIFVTIYLVYLHYLNPLKAPCNINAYFSCDTVNKSSYSLFLGIPVAILGLINYVFLFLVSLGLLKGVKFEKLHKKLNPRNVIWLLFVIVTFGLAFSLRLTYAEFFIIEAVCLFCLAQQIIILLQFFILGRILMLK